MIEPLPKLGELRDIVTHLSKLLDSPAPFDAGWSLAYANCMEAIKPFANDKREVLRPALNLFKPEHLRDKIMELVSQEFGLPETAITGPSRTEEVTVARFAVMWLLRQQSDYRITLSRAGRMLNRDHGTIIHGVRRATEIMLLDKEYHRRVFSIMDKIERYRKQPVNNPVNNLGNGSAVPSC